MILFLRSGDNHHILNLHYYDHGERLLRLVSSATICAVKWIKTAVQLGSLVRFLYDSNTNCTKRRASIAASGKAFDY